MRANNSPELGYFRPDHATSVPEEQKRSASWLSPSDAVSRETGTVISYPGKSERYLITDQGAAPDAEHGGCCAKGGSTAGLRARPEAMTGQSRAPCAVVARRRAGTKERRFSHDYLFEMVRDCAGWRGSVACPERAAPAALQACRGHSIAVLGSGSDLPHAARGLTMVLASTCAVGSSL